MISDPGLRCKILFLLFGLGVAGCRPDAQLRPASPSLVVPGEVVLALTPRQIIRLESREGSLLEVGWSTGSLSCEISDPVAGAWAALREIALNGEPDVRSDMSLDPNRYSFGSVVAFVRPADESHFHIWYIEEVGSMARAAGLVQEVLDECQAGIRFEITLLKEGP